jgi:DNA-directed RNA polymerase specialized sigma24 family protein
MFTEDQNKAAPAEAFQLLLSRLSPDSETAGKEYERLRTGLVNYFRIKGHSRSVDLADQTLDRVARLLSAREVSDLPGFCFGVARHICMEQYRAESRERTANEWFTQNVDSHDDDRRYELMRRCLESLAGDEQELLKTYYRESLPRDRTSIREQLARQAGLSIDHLRLRIHRLRRKLENCLNRSRLQ